MGGFVMKTSITVLLAFATTLLISPHAQAFPDRPIKFVVASPAGSPPDVMARLLSEKMAGILGQPVIVDNRPGAGGTIGAKSVLAAEPDGHTLLLGSTSTLLIAPAVYKRAGYNAASFAPISRIADSSEILSAHPSVAANSVAELVALAKSKPGTINFASAGNGTLPHIEGELLKAQAQIQISHVPYRGGGNALTGLVAGQVQMMFSTLTQMLPYIREGKLKGLAISSPVRSKLAPDIPTLVESGFPQFITTSITTVVAPPNTPIEIRRQLSKAVVGALASDEVQKSLARLGGEARPSTPEETEAFLAEQSQRWTQIIKTVGISVD
jgi:tripartite-type tricarboxylate transporter receptor subunit TctC